MDKLAILGQIQEEAFKDEMAKMAESGDKELKSLMERFGRGLKRGAGKGKGMPGGLRRNKNEGECAVGGPGKSQGGGRGKGANRKG